MTTEIDNDEEERIYALAKKIADVHIEKERHSIYMENIKSSMYMKKVTEKNMRINQIVLITQAVLSAIFTTILLWILLK